MSPPNSPIRRILAASSTPSGTTHAERRPRSVIACTIASW
jgi:hypothetical protein